MRSFKKVFSFVSIYLQALFYFLAGLNHFISPAIYVSMIPSWLPYPELLNGLSGLAEMVAGLLFAFPKTRWWGAWGIVWLLIAIFPANIQMAINGATPDGFPWEADLWVLWGRLPLQFLLMYWAYVFRHGPNKGGDKSGQ